jgi:hypothetical protein
MVDERLAAALCRFGTVNDYFANARREDPGASGSGR